MKRSLQRAFSLIALALPFLFSSHTAHAEPPMMKEHAVKPRIEARSEDGRFSVSLGGFIQARYTLALQNTTLAHSRFDTPRTRLYVFGHVHSKDVRYRLMLGTRSASLSAELYDAYIDWRTSDALRIRAGHFKIPVFREWVESARLLASVERSILTQTLAPGRDWGGMITGELFSSHIDYAAGLFNGSKRTAEDGPILAARLAWNTLGRSIDGEVDFENSPRAIVMGLSGYTSFEAPRLRDSAAGIEMAYRERGLDITMEAMAHEKRMPNDKTSLIGGFYVRADRYLPTLHASIGGRATRLVGLAEPITRTEIDLDAAYYPAEHDLKIATNLGLGRLHDEGTWEPFFMVQVQAGF